MSAIFTRADIREPEPGTLPVASRTESLKVLALGVLPLLAKGLLIRRPKVVAALAATGGEGSGIRLLARLRRKYGRGPLLLRFPFRPHLLILSGKDVQRILAETPQPFESDSREKHSALMHFQPEGVLISRGEERASRRRLNEQALETPCPVHSLAPELLTYLEGESGLLLRDAESQGQLAYEPFKKAWFRMVRQAVLGPATRDDETFTRTLEILRGGANWTYLKPRRRKLRDGFLADLRARLQAAPDASLGRLAIRCAKSDDAPADQVAQWLFAFDAAAIATYRTLALLGVHPLCASRAEDEIAAESHDLPFLRACILDCIRIWPTTPAILRELDRDMDWGGRTIGKGTGVLIHLPYLHRDSTRIPYANSFVPDVWLDGRAERWPFIPFSAGPAICPAQNLVLMLASHWLAAMMRDHRYYLRLPHKLMPSKLPPTFDQFHQKIGIVRRSH
jgi:cytochrome P450